jgi:Ulp1 family protease
MASRKWFESGKVDLIQKRNIILPVNEYEVQKFS